MAFELQSTDALPDQVRRIAIEEIDSAIKQLASGKDREEAVHEARKSIKKIRGLLRLVQGELGPVYGLENDRFRDMGRQLSNLRDAAATIEMFNRLVSEYQQAGEEGKQPGPAIAKADLASIRRGLEADKAETEKRAGGAKTTQTVLASLKSARDRVNSWPLHRHRFRAVKDGLSKRYSRGRKAMSIAAGAADAPNLHQWRKRAKDQRYHIRLLTGLDPIVLREREKNLHDLESWLGDHQNLAVLSAQIEAHPDRYGAEAPVAEFLALAKRAAEVLRERAFALGEKLYREKPKKFVSRIEELWEAWQQTSQRKPSSSSGAKARKSAAA